ncbi:MAG: GldG family protein [Methylophaga sp.]|nr:GldG family protein [Methylophaga sp.]
MKLNRQYIRMFTVQKWLFWALLAVAVVVLAQLAEHTNTRFDLTASQRHSLSPTTLSLLQGLEQPVDIEIFISHNHEFRDLASSILKRYQAASSQLNVHFTDPEQAPQRVRELNIRQQGEIVISKGARRQHVLDFSEQSITNALLSIARQQQPLILFVEGHGERSPFSDANFGLSLWSDYLQATGVQIESLNLAASPTIPEDTRVIVIASPQRAWLEGEITLIQRYIDDGGNLLWLAEPEQHLLLSPVAEQLGLYFNSGRVLDVNAQLLGIQDPGFVVIADYANHPVAAATPSVTIFPDAVAIEQNTAVATDWNYTSLLHTGAQSWIQMNTDADDTFVHEFNPNTDMSGPFSIGYLLERWPDSDDSPQRIAVLGDGDFASNTYLGNAANLDFANALINWLTEDDALIEIPFRTTPDNQLELSDVQSMLLGIGFLFVLPLLLAGIGLLLWWLRRRR